MVGVILASRKTESVTRVQLLNESANISFRANSLRKGMNSATLRSSYG